MINGSGESGGSLLRLVPEITRARFWRLYAKNGGRLVDLWQFGGKALLGHNPPGFLRAFKNSAERGLWTPVPHAAETRLLKALAALLPGRCFRLYSDTGALERALIAAGFAAGTAAVWRPFSGDESAVRAEPLLVPVLPAPFPGVPAALALGMAVEARFPPSQVLSPAALAAVTRCVYDLLAAPERGNPAFPRLDNALKQNGFWRRQGIYLFPGIDKKGYEALFRRFLEAGFLLPPVPADPAILPGALSPGEEARLSALLDGA